jgi:hypothetical protein
VSPSIKKARQGSNRSRAAKAAVLVSALAALSLQARAQTGAYGGNPGALADFNNDGKLDLAWTDASSGAAVYLGNGDGSFRYSTFLAVPDADVCTGSAAADFNGDGQSDVVLECLSNSSPAVELAVFFGKGNGQFSSPLIISLGLMDSPRSLLVGDVNGDGRPDLVASGLVSGSSFASVSVFLNNGDGTFTAGQSFAAGSVAASFLADLTGDGKLDLVITRGNGDVEVFQGKGDGTFLKPGVQYPMTQGMNSLALADFNGDGRPDLAACGFLGANSNVAKGSAYALAFGQNGGFGVPQVHPGTGKHSACTSVVAADFNGDGKMDFALSAWDESAAAGLTVFLGKGDGTFSAPANYGVLQQGHMIVGDLNGDGKPDILILEAVQTAINKGNGTFKIIASGI